MIHGSYTIKEDTLKHHDRFSGSISGHDNIFNIVFYSVSVVYLVGAYMIDSKIRKNIQGAWDHILEMSVMYSKVEA